MWSTKHMCICQYSLVVERFQFAEHCPLSSQVHLSHLGTLEANLWESEQWLQHTVATPARMSISALSLLSGVHRHASYHLNVCPFPWTFIQTLEPRLIDTFPTETRSGSGALPRPGGELVDIRGFSFAMAGSWNEVTQLMVHACNLCSHIRFAA